MQVTHIVSALPFKVDKKQWRSGLLFFILFVLVSQIAPLSSPSYLWDDLVWYWTYHVDGSDALFDLLTQVGHPAYWLFIDFAYRVFGAQATLPTSIIAILFHVINSLLVFHLMRLLNAGRVTAFLAFVFYLASPYYFNRGTVSHYFYDIFMFFFLFSVYLGAPGRKGRLSRFVAAPAFQVAYFGLPTLVMLEPLRLAVHWELCKHDYKKTLNSILIYWLTAAISAIGAFMVFQPKGYYRGYNELKFSAGHLFEGILEYFVYLPKILFFHVNNVITVLRQPLDWPFVILLSAIAVFFIRKLPEQESKKPKLNTALLLPLGVTLLLSGSLPYVLAGRLPDPHDFNSRLFFVAGLGLVIALSAALGMIRSKHNHMLVMSLLLGIFLVSGYHQAKTYMYDHIVRQSVIAGLLSDETRGSPKGKIGDEDIFVVLVGDPPFWDLFTQRRMVTPVEFSVPINIHQHPGRGRWLVYNYDARDFSPPDYFVPPRGCSLAAHDRHPCPANYVIATFRLQNNMSLSNFSFPELFYQSFIKDTPIAVGSLEFTTEPRSMVADEMAVRWYRKSAEEGIYYAQNTLGLMYLDGFVGVPQDDEQAFVWFGKAAAQGMLDARLNLGVMYLEGRGVKKDVKTAVRLISSAAQEGYARAEYNLGVLYEQGLGLPKSEAEAFKWYLKAAEQDNAAAQTQAGLMYARGRGTERNDIAASRWLMKAVENRNMIAQYAMGIMFAEGRGVAKDIRLAATLIKESAYQGYPQALFSLGYLYEHGIGVSRDMGESYFWYRLADRHGDSRTRKTASGVSAAVGQSLSAAEKRKLNQRIDQWKPVKPAKKPMWH